MHAAHHGLEPVGAAAAQVGAQLENLDQTLLTRRDIEQLLGVSTARAATLMQAFGGEMTGYQRTLPRTRLLQQLQKHRARAAFAHEEERRERLVAELRKARLTGIRVKLPVASLGGKLANLPDGVSVERGRIEVRFDGAKNAVEQLYSLAARARERLGAVRGARRRRGRGGEEMTDALQWSRHRRSTPPRPRRRHRVWCRSARRRSRCRG